MKTDEPKNVLQELQGPFNRLNDAYFKSALGSSERKHILIAFLNALLRHIEIEGEKPLVIKDVEFIDRETSAKSRMSKMARFDIFARAVDGRIFHIEIQNAKKRDFMKRCFYYAASDYATQLQHGEHYERLEPVIFIGIMNFNIFGSYEHSENWHTIHRLMNTATHESNFKDVELHMVELPLLRRYIENCGMKLEHEVEEILCYFARIGDEKLMEEIAERNSVVSDLRAFERLYTSDPWVVRDYMLNEFDRLQDAYDRRLDREESRAEGRAEGREEGRAEGREEGLEEGHIEVARTLREEGIMTDEMIARIAKLPIEVVRSL